MQFRISGLALDTSFFFFLKKIFTECQEDILSSVAGRKNQNVKSMYSGVLWNFSRVPKVKLHCLQTHGPTGSESTTSIHFKFPLQVEYMCINIRGVKRSLADPANS